VQVAERGERLAGDLEPQRQGRRPAGLT